MQKKDLVAMFMESPFYFDLTIRERLFLLQDLARRFGRIDLRAHPAPVAPESPIPVIALEPE